MSSRRVSWVVFLLAIGACSAGKSRKAPLDASGQVATTAEGQRPTPDATRAALTATTARQWYEQLLRAQGLAGAIIEDSALAIGDFHFFGIEQPTVRPSASRFFRAAANGDGIVTERPGLLRTLLLAGDVDEVSRRIEFLLGDGGRSLFRPGRSPSNDRISPKEWALIQAPVRSEAPDGTVTLVAWFGSPPQFAPIQLTLTAPRAAADQTEWKAASALLPASANPEQDVIAGLSAPDEATLRWAMRAVEFSKNPLVVPPLIALLAHTTVAIRFGALGALLGIDDPRCLEPIIKALPKEPDAGVRYMMIRVLGRQRASQGVAAIAAALDDPDYNVRADAFEALTRIGDAAALKALEKAAR